MRALYVLLLLALPISAMAANCRENANWYIDDVCLAASVDATAEKVEYATIELVKGADEMRRPLLNAAHSAWREYRNRQCKLEFDTTRVQHARYPQHGTMAPSMEQRCMIRLNDTRLLELSALAKRS